MKESALHALEQAINAYLKLDPESQGRLRALEGKVATIELKPFHLIFQCSFEHEQIVFSADETLKADTHICGTPIQLAAVSLLKSNRQQFFAEDVSMTGSAEVGHEIIALFDHVQIDWEEYLSQLIGDQAAHRSGRILKRAKNWLKHLDSSLTSNISEFVHEEAEWFPTREALQDWFADVDDLSMDVDRISAKIALLKSHSK